MTIPRPLCIPALLIILLGCTESRTNQSSEEINGFIFDGPSKPPITNDMVAPMTAYNANWIAVTPEAFTYHQDLSVKSFYDSGNWYSETLKGSIEITEIAKKNNLKVLIKPHLTFLHDLSNWDKPDLDIHKEKDRKIYIQEFKQYTSSLGRKTKGTWRGDFDVINESDWAIWEDQHTNFIVDCATIADSVSADMFCIGTELSISATKREKYWRSLIKKVRTIYSGPITFSANWDNYSKIKFWDELDYIGISAYFPLSEQSPPTNIQIKAGWEIHFDEIKETYRKFDKPVLFTEFGYTSSTTAAKSPWSDERNDPNSEQLQSILFQEIFNQFWSQPWFAGGFIWKWKYTNNGNTTAYSPQGKEAMQVVKKWYGK